MKETNTIAQAILELPQCSEGQLRLEDGKCFLKSNGEFLALEITYTGSLLGYSKLPFGWYINEGNYQIIIFRTTEQVLPVDSNNETVLFEYKGSFNPLKCVLATYDRSVINCALYNNRNANKSHEWDKHSMTFNKTTSTYSSLNKVSKP